jgi:hypothetical protein
VTKRSKFFTSFILGLAVIFGALAYFVWVTFYDHILPMSAVRHISAEEISGTHPLQLKISVNAIDSAHDIRTVTVKRSGQSLTVLYHLSLSGLVKPDLDWREPYLLTIPETVREVRFGRDSNVIWQRHTTSR